MSNGAPNTERRMIAWIGKAVRVEGKVISAEDLTIGQEAKIKADLLAKTVTISGKVTGNVRAVEKVDLQATGTVNGDITAPRFVMADGATVMGKVQAG